MGRAEHAFDYVIAGGGTAGCILAGRLSEDPVARVCLVEAGPPDRHWSVRVPGGAKRNYVPGTPLNWSFETVPQPALGGRRIFQPRGKVLGGSSSINGMVFLRGHALDYQRWVAEGAAGWSYAEVLPYFRRLERWRHGPSPYRGSDGPVGVQHVEPLSALDEAFLEAGRQAGFPATDDVNGLQQEGMSRFDMNVDRGYRASASHAFLRPARGRNNLLILTGVRAHRVIVEKGRAVAVECATGSRLHRIDANREVVLAAGAFGTPQLLMLSGIGPAGHLRGLGIGIVTDQPGVGENLQDHIETYIQRRCRLPISLNGNLLWHRKLATGLEWLLLKTGEAALNQARTGAFLRGDPSDPHANIQIHFFAAFMRGWFPPPGVHGYRASGGPMRPESRGTLRLASADPQAAPLIDPRYLATETDWREMRLGYELMREIFAQAAFAAFDGGWVEPAGELRDRAELDAFIRSTASSGYHPCGTCRMGAERDPTAVTDAEGRVRGVAGLRVCDASLMPSVPSSNINAIVMMMAEKIADRIRGRAPLPAESLPWRNAAAPRVRPPASEAACAGS
jgi:choline dehydrogenase